MRTIFLKSIFGLIILVLSFQFVAPAIAPSAQAIADVESEIDDLSAYIDRMEKTIWSDIPESERMTEIIRQQLEKAPDDNLQARLDNIIAYRKILLSDFPGSIKNILGARKLSLKTGNSEEEAVSYRLEGFILSLLGDYSEALTLLFRALDIQRKIESTNQYWTLHYISRAYFEMGDYEKYLEYGQLLAEQREAQLPGANRALMYYTIGEALLNLDRPKQAIELLTKATAEWTAYAPSFVAQSQRLVADAEYRLGRSDKALQLLAESAASAEEQGYNLDIDKSMSLKATILSERGQNSEALVVLEELRSYAATEKKAKVEKIAYEQMARIYEKTGDFEKAYKAYHKFKEINDNLFNTNNATILALFQARFDTEQKELQISQLEESAKLRGFIIALVLALLAGSLYVGHRTNKVRRQLMQNAVKLEAAYREAEQATKAKSEFLARMSHEIRTPMNAIIGLGHLMQRTVLDAAQSDYLSKIQQSSENLFSILNDILDFSRVEAGKLTIEHIPFSLDRVLAGLSDVVAIKAEEKGLELLFDVGHDVPDNLVGDPTRLRQVLINLVSNAIKFTEKGEIILRIHLHESEEGHMLQVCVSDTGIGMSREQCERLFQSFAQADGSVTRKYGGTGLGLAISKQLCELMGGSIWVKSKVGVGSKFEFEIKIEFGEAVSRAQSVRPLSYLRFLVVDDNEAARMILKNQLNGFGFHADVVENAEQAMMMYKAALMADKGPYHIVLMDWEMPGTTGVEVAAAIKAVETEAKPPIIILVTAHDQEALTDAADAESIDGFLTKPVSASLLFDTIIELVGLTPDGKPEPPLVPSAVFAGLTALKGADVLLVEDNAINRQVATGFLVDLGLNVEDAHNGLEAIEKVAQKDYDLVLMDIQMPEMDGLTATKKIRENPKFARLPIVAMTANALNSDRKNALAAGMNDHIAKPFEVNDFYKMLLRWIEPKSEQSVFFSDEDLNGLFPSNTGAGSEKMPVFPFNHIAGEVGLSHFVGRLERYVEALSSYKKLYSGAGEKMKTLLEEDSVDEARRLAHSLKSVSAYLGATTLSTEAAQMEKLLRAGEAKTAMEMLPAFLAATKEVDEDLLLIDAIVNPEEVEAALELNSETEPEDAGSHMI